MKDNYQGFFLTIEGTDGSGKSTISKKLIEYLNQHQINNIYTREPGGNGINVCEKIRNLLLDNDNLNNRTEALLLAANRSEHIQQLIIPALLQNKFIVCDRYIDSSIAYQGYARKLGARHITKINMFATDKLWPDLTIFLSLDPKISLKRINTRNQQANHLDKAPLEFHNDVFMGYHQIAKKYKKRVVIINANQTPEVILQQIIDAINKKLKKGEYFWNEI